MADSNRYYVYILSRNGVPFYVGKGCGNRMTSHEECAGRHASCKHLTCRVIRKEWREGGCITHEKVYENLTEEDAHAQEIALIAYGREQQWPLVNQTIGGEGLSGYKWTPEQLEMRKQVALREIAAHPERLAKFAYSNTGRSMSDEERARRSVSVRKGWSDPQKREQQRQAIVDRWQTEEFRQKQRAAMADPEVRKKCGAANIGNTRKALTYSGFVAPDGTIYEHVHNLALFCAEHHLAKSSMCLVAAEKQYKHRGWRKYPLIDPPERKSTYHGTGFVSPDGVVYDTIANLNVFCAEHGLDLPAMSMVNSGKRRIHKGWTRYTPTPSQ